MRGVALLAVVSASMVAQVGVARAQLAFVQEGTARKLVRGNEPAAASAFPAAPAGVNLAYGTFLVDLSGDSWLDAVLVNHGQFPHTSGEWINTGDGTGFGQNLFTVAVSGANLGNTGWAMSLENFSPGSAPLVPNSFADINGDGRPDVIWGGWSGYAVVCYNQGPTSGSGWSGPAFACTQAPYVTGWGDVNGDGRLDLEALDPATPYDWYSYELRQLPKVWFLNDGTTNPLKWQRASDLFALSITAEPGAILDLNQDGFPDQIYGTPAPSGSRGTFGLQAAGLVVKLGQATGKYATAASGLESIKDPIATIEDVDEDGCLDVGFDPTGYRDNPYWYLQEKDAGGHCAAHFHAVARTALPYYPGFARYTVDVDNSGTPAKVVINHTAYGNNDRIPGGVHIYKKQPGGAHAEITNHGIVQLETYQDMLSPGDWNGDGLLDFGGIGLATQSGTDSGVCLWTNKTVTSNHWLDVRLPSVSGFFVNPAKIEVFAAGHAGDPAFAVGAAQVTRTGRHWPTLPYHFGLGEVASVDVKVTFPDGSVVVEPAPEVDQGILVTPVRDMPPSSVPTASPTKADIGQTIVFDGSASADPDGTIVSFTWDFRDGTTATGATVPHAYAAAGTFQVRLTTTDDHGASTTATVTVAIADHTPPSAGIASVTLVPAVSDASGVARVDWSMDGTAFSSTSTPPFSLSVTLASLAPGPHAFVARAFDPSGNAGDSPPVTIGR